MTELIRPVKGQLYRLTYLGPFDPRGREVLSYDFEFMATRGSKYYFHSAQRGIDLTLDVYRFNEFLNNTPEKLIKGGNR